MLGRKLLLLGGKGGVGKTTLSSAIALLLSERKGRTLLISTDPAHSLSDIFETEPGKGVREVSSKLHYLEIDPYLAVREYMERALTSMEALMSPEAFSRLKDLLLNVEGTPGAEEAATLEELSKVVLGSMGEYEHFVVDTAPTGHTLTMLRTVGRIGRWMEDLLSVRMEAQRLREAGGFSRREDRVLEILRERRERFTRFHELLISKSTMFIPVLTPEKLPILETERLVRELTQMGINLEVLIVNKVLPENTVDEFLLNRKAQEREYLRDIRRRFSSLRVVEVPMRERDVRGMRALREIVYELERRLGL